MFMGQDGAAHDGQISIGAGKVTRKEVHDVEETLKGQAADFHGLMLAIKEDTMLIEIGIGRILKAPGLPFHLIADDPMVGPCWMVDAALVAFIFQTELAERVARRLNQFGSRDGLGVLFWLGQIDGDFQIAILSRALVVDIFGNGLVFNIVIGLTELIKVCNSPLGISCIGLPKVSIDLAWGWRDEVHELGSYDVLLLQEFSTEAIFHS